MYENGTIANYMIFENFSDRKSKNNKSGTMITARLRAQRNMVVTPDE